MEIQWKNKFYFGDNLIVLRNYIPNDSIDLIYLDPPFNSNANYNVFFSEEDGAHSAAQVTALRILGIGEKILMKYSTN